MHRKSFGYGNNLLLASIIVWIQLFWEKLVQSHLILYFPGIMLWINFWILWTAYDGIVKLGKQYMNQNWSNGHKFERFHFIYINCWLFWKHEFLKLDVLFFCICWIYDLLSFFLPLNLSLNKNPTLIRAVCYLLMKWNAQTHCQKVQINCLQLKNIKFFQKIVSFFSLVPHVSKLKDQSDFWSVSLNDRTWTLFQLNLTAS